ncbi:MAG: hypothetical protein ACTS9Y_03220 [Methylophilus sp.]|uniref:hypothetical protein n=1 Tax=Methylophilus sp. TaxID=29541 RepID=UPI003FA00361
MNRAFANTSLFTMTYLICVLPTYFSAYLGMVENTTLSSTFSLPSILYLLSMLAIWAICLIRGAVIGKNWLVLIPTVAFVFNLTPALTAIPIVPYAYHLLAILLAVASYPGALINTDAYEMR